MAKAIVAAISGAVFGWSLVQYAFGGGTVALAVALYAMWANLLLNIHMASEREE